MMYIQHITSTAWYKGTAKLSVWTELTSPLQFVGNRHKDEGRGIAVFVELAHSMKLWPAIAFFCDLWEWLLFCVPSYSSGVYFLHFFGEIFAYVTVFFFTPTVEVVAFRVHGWCMLGVFLLLAFTCLGHECQDLLRLHEMHVCTD